MTPLIKAKKSRHACLSVYLIFLIIAFVLGSVFFFFVGSVVARGRFIMPTPLRLIFGTMNLLMAGCTISIWNWKLQGFQGFVAIGVIGGLLNAYVSHSFFPLIFVPAGILILYAVLHIGKENQGWKQLD